MTKSRGPRLGDGQGWGEAREEEGNGKGARGTSVEEEDGGKAGKRAGHEGRGRGGSVFKLG